LSVQSKDEQIKKLTEVGKVTDLVSVKKSTIDTLTTYGEQAIPAITEIVKASHTETVRIYGLEAIKKVKDNAGTAAPGT
jgi:hypothetical protein